MASSSSNPLLQLMTSLPPNMTLATQDMTYGVTSYHEPAEQVQITSTDMLLGGLFLLLISLVTIPITAFLTWLVARDWDNIISKSRTLSFDTLTFTLTVSDVLFGLLVALPAALHMTFYKTFSMAESMRYYTSVIEFLVFEYLFLLRVMIIAGLALDKALVCLMPLRYGTVFVTEKRVKIICGIIAVIPLVVKTVPNMTHMLQGGSAGTICLRFINNEVSPTTALRNNHKYIVPLTCSVRVVSAGDDVTTNSLHSYVLVEVALLAAVTLFCWLVIVLASIFSIFTVYRYHYKTSSYRSRPSLSTAKRESQQMTVRAQWLRAVSVNSSERRILKACVLVITITITFSLTNFPYVCVWWSDYLFRSVRGEQEVVLNNKHRLYLTLLTFISLVSHPFLYWSRMSIIKSVLVKVKRRVKEVATIDSYLALHRVSSLSNNRNTVGLGLHLRKGEGPKEPETERFNTSPC